MPNKTIYVTDSDLPIFERAQELAGNNLSATIAEALKRFIKVEEAKQIGFEEITIKLGEEGTYQNKRFIGKELARTQVIGETGTIKVLIVYETAKHRYALYTKEISDLSESFIQVNIQKKIMEKFGIDLDVSKASSNKYRLDVYDTVSELRSHIPEKLYLLLNQDEDDFLDI
ncbi:MAG: EXLDI protein [Tuberibacillus sp.]